MSEGQTQLTRHAGRRPLLLAAVMLVGIAVVLAVVRWEGLFEPPAPPEAVPKAAPATAPSPPFAKLPPPVPLAPAPPSFDIVRVEPSGRAVMAGRAPAGSLVTVNLEGPKGRVVVGTAQSDAEGQWVLVPDAPLPAGAGTLTLSARLAHGKSLAGLDKVTVVVPIRPGEAPPVALLNGPGATPRLVQAPPAASGASPVGLDLLRYGARGGLQLAGRAPANADVRVYLDNHSLGEATADGSGHWSLSVPQTAVQPGPHSIRLDQLSATGEVVARVAVPFERLTDVGPGKALSPANVRVMIVKPGECLWVIAEHIYGAGMRYTLIFQANRDQIRDPRLIYPGQILMLPAAPAAGEKPG